MKQETSKIRIIGGKWRSRFIEFPTLPELRPTPNRIRETLFNWLASEIHGAVCLDLFAGSGALGFEALSRGAKSVVMADQSHTIIHNLRKNAKLLGAEQSVELHCTSFPGGLSAVLNSHRFNIVFLDPPFHKNMLSACAKWLEEQNCLVQDALIYIEAESALRALPVPDNWQIIHSKNAGSVGYHLVRKVDRKDSQS